MLHNFLAVNWNCVKSSFSSAVSRSASSIFFNRSPVSIRLGLLSRSRSPIRTITMTVVDKEDKTVQFIRHAPCSPWVQIPALAIWFRKIAELKNMTDPEPNKPSSSIPMSRYIHFIVGSTYFPLYPDAVTKFNSSFLSTLLHPQSEFWKQQDGIFTTVDADPECFSAFLHWCDMTPFPNHLMIRGRDSCSWTRLIDFIRSYRRRYSAASVIYSFNMPTTSSILYTSNHIFYFGVYNWNVATIV